MNKKDKKAAREEARRLEDLKRQQQQQRMRQELQRIKQQQDKLRHASSPLLQYGLLDAYEFFLKHLAESGIPQPNIFEFAAQSVLKYEKRSKRKGEELKKIEDYNKSVVENQRMKQQQKSTKKRPLIRPNMLPFKGEINNTQLDILSRLKAKKVDTKQEETNGDENNEYTQ